MKKKLESHDGGLTPLGTPMLACWNSKRVLTRFSKRCKYGAISTENSKLQPPGIGSETIEN